MWQLVVIRNKKMELNKFKAVIHMNNGANRYLKTKHDAPVISFNKTFINVKFDCNYKVSKTLNQLGIKHKTHRHFRVLLNELIPDADEHWFGYEEKANRVYFGLLNPSGGKVVMFYYDFGTKKYAFYESANDVSFNSKEQFNTEFIKLTKSEKMTMKQLKEELVRERTARLESELELGQLREVHELSVLRDEILMNELEQLKAEHQKLLKRVEQLENNN